MQSSIFERINQIILGHPEFLNHARWNLVRRVDQEFKYSFFDAENVLSLRDMFVFREKETGPNLLLDFEQKIEDVTYFLSENLQEVKQKLDEAINSVWKSQEDDGIAMAMVLHVLMNRADLGEKEAEEIFNAYEKQYPNYLKGIQDLSMDIVRSKDMRDLRPLILDYLGVKRIFLSKALRVNHRSKYLKAAQDEMARLKKESSDGTLTIDQYLSLPFPVQDETLTYLWLSYRSTNYSEKKFGIFLQANPQIISLEYDGFYFKSFGLPPVQTGLKELIIKSESVITTGSLKAFLEKNSQIEFLKFVYPNFALPAMACPSLKTLDIQGNMKGLESFLKLNPQIEELDFYGYSDDLPPVKMDSLKKIRIKTLPDLFGSPFHPSQESIYAFEKLNPHVKIETY